MFDFINSYINYLVSSFDCVLAGDKKFIIKKGVKYEFKNINDFSLVFGFKNEIPFIFDDRKSNQNILKFKFNNDNYYFLFSQKANEHKCFKFSFKNNEIFVSISSKIILTINSELKCEQNVENLNFSHYEIEGNLCLIHFTGERNFLIVLKNSEVVFANFYDECNISENEKYFMFKLNDSLNHGRVCEIKDGEVTSYLVYLDNEEMKLKETFVANIFVDCVLAGNYKYCNELICDDLKVENENSIKEFFPVFDDYYPIQENVLILTNKNTLAGIFEFSVDNCKISNIMNLM